MKTSIAFTVTLLAALSAASAPVSYAQAGGPETRLVLQVTVDGLRADLLTRAVEHFGDGGFRYLLENGSVFAQESYWSNFDPGPIAVMHGSPWRYDTHVPVIFAGAGVPVGTVYRQIQPADVAPTLAALLGMSAPASAQGTVLPEVFPHVQ